eukprot:1580508-Pyramimonas_sp.AAC.1
MGRASFLIAGRSGAHPRQLRLRPDDDPTAEMDSAAASRDNRGCAIEAEEAVRPPPDPVAQRVHRRAPLRARAMPGSFDRGAGSRALPGWSRCKVQSSLTARRRTDPAH